jgi:hypothetical protein
MSAKFAQLAALDAAGEHGQADPVQAALRLPVNADVVPIDVAGRVVGHAGARLVAQILDQFFLELFRSPVGNQKLQAGVGALFPIPEITKNARDGAHGVHGLIGLKQHVDPRAKVRLRAQPAADAQAKARRAGLLVTRGN